MNIKITLTLLLSLSLLGSCENSIEKSLENPEVETTDPNEEEEAPNEENEEPETPNEEEEEDDEKIEPDIPEEEDEVIFFDKNLFDDYGIAPNTGESLTSALQSVFDEFSAEGGGALYFPAGTYLFSGLCMRSNVHLYIDPEAVLSPDTALGSDAGNMLYFSYSTSSSNTTFVENCSIQCSKSSKQYTVDYSMRNTSYIATALSVLYDFSASNDGFEKVRFFCARMVRNFTIADAYIIDNWTNHCGGTLTPFVPKSSDNYGDEVWDWEVSRPTNGTVKDITIINARMGYGLVQLHGAESIHFENLDSTGGVTLRMETGSGAVYSGINNITGKNIINREGLAAVMVNPHSVNNGIFTIEDVYAYSSSYAVFTRKGYLDDDDDTTKGVYSNDSSISNIYAEFGLRSQIDDKDVWLAPAAYSLTDAGGYDYDKLAQYYSLTDEYGCRDTFYGPSLVAVSHESIDVDNPTNPDTDNGEYIVTFNNIRTYGFPAGNDASIYCTDGIDPDGGTTAGSVTEAKVWPFVRAIKYANGVANVTGY